MFNLLGQVIAVTRFSFASLPQRLGSSASAMLGIAGVVAVMVGVLSIAQGIMSTMTSASGVNNVMVLRSGADSEMTSGFGGDDAKLIAEAPGLAMDGDSPIASRELFVIINLPLRATGTDANVPLRGIEPAAPLVREGFEIIEGRMFEPGIAEVVVGLGANMEFAGLEIGSEIDVGTEQWPVVGVFAANGGIAESEVWVDSRVLQSAYRRGNSYQSIHATLESPDRFNEFKDSRVA